MRALHVEQVVRSEGPAALWKGNLVTILHRLPYSSINFWTYEHSNKLLRRHLPPGTDFARTWLSGAVAGLVACSAVSLLGGAQRQGPGGPGRHGVLDVGRTTSTCTLAAHDSSLCPPPPTHTHHHHTCTPQAYPLDLVRTRLAAQTQGHYYSGILPTLQRIVADEGAAGLYRGLGATLLQVRARAGMVGGLACTRTGPHLPRAPEPCCPQTTDTKRLLSCACVNNRWCRRWR
jgi:solute carrier family 25 phosphate transporter 23/24/25/41